MPKIILFIIVVFALISFYTFHIDHSISVYTFYAYKGHLNRAVHAAALQKDDIAFAEGIIQIDQVKAYDFFLEYLKKNMRLDDSLNPLAGPIKGPVEILKFEVYNGPFPADKSGVEISYPEYNFRTTLYRPGVIAIVKVQYKKTFNILGDVTWNINASHEITY